MRTAFLIMALVGSFTTMLCQGFDWQTSPRYPYEIPKRYVGVEVGTGYTFHYGSLDYLEKDLGITCCSYESGSGIPLRFSIALEEWLAPSFSVNVGLGITRYGTSFATASQSVPLSSGELLQTQYQLTGSITYATISGGASLRLMGTHLTVGGGLRLHAYLGGSLRQKEVVLAPATYQFTGNPRSRERELGNSFLDSPTPIQIEPYIQIGYNLAIANGFYLSPSISVGLPLLSITTADDWRLVDIGAHVRLMKGL